MKPRILVYGYGNPGRLDDGLGPAVVRDLARRGLGGEVTLESGYQLAIEDAALVAEHDGVVFADADRSCPEPFELRRLVPRRDLSFTTHALAPEALLGLALEHFDCATAGFILGIRGYEFDAFGERLSWRARRNLAAAAGHLERALRDGSLAHEAVLASQGR